MKLSDLFEIVYVDNEIKEEFFDTIENLKINSLLLLTKILLDNFVFVTTKNIIYNRPKSKIKLEFHNMDSNNLNNEVIISVLNKLQNIINSKETEVNEEITVIPYEDKDDYEADDHEADDHD